MTNRRYECGLALVLLLWLACCFKANAQVAVSPISTPRYVPRDTNGNTLPGGKVCVFQAGTTTPLTSYSESTGSSANTNPVTLDSAGAANIWVQSQAYKIIVYSSVGADSNCPNAGVSQFSIDGINPGALGNTAITGTLSVSGAVTLSSTLAVATSISVASGTALTTTNSTGTGNLVKATSPTIATPSISSPTFTSGIGNNGSGHKHIRVASCTTGAGANATCTTTVTWVTSFADANYTAVCMLDGATGTPSILNSGAKGGASLQVVITNGPGGGASSATGLNCIADHD